MIISQHWCQIPKLFAKMWFVHPAAVKSPQTALNFSLYSIPGHPGVSHWKASHSEKQIVKPQEGRCKAAGPWWSFVGHQSQSLEWMEVKCDCGAHVVLALNRPQGALPASQRWHSSTSLSRCVPHTLVSKKSHLSKGLSGGSLGLTSGCSSTTS